MSKRKSTGLDAQNIQAGYYKLKAIEGGDIGRYLQQANHVASKPRWMWVMSCLQRDVFELRQNVMMILDEGEAKEKHAMDQRARPWRIRWWEWIKSMPFGRNKTDDKKIHDEDPPEPASIPTTQVIDDVETSEKPNTEVSEDIGASALPSNDNKEPVLDN